MLGICWLAVVPKPHCHYESGNDSGGYGDHGVEPGKHCEGEKNWRESPKSYVESITFDRGVEDAEAVVVDLDTDFWHDGCMEGLWWKGSWDTDTVCMFSGDLNGYRRRGRSRV